MVLNWADPLKISAAVVFGMNALGFLGTALTHTHKLTDITGTGAFVASSWATCAALVLHQRAVAPQKPIPLRPIVLTAAVRHGVGVFLHELLTAFLSGHPLGHPSWSFLVRQNSPFSGGQSTLEIFPSTRGTSNQISRLLDNTGDPTIPIYSPASSI